MKEKVLGFRVLLQQIKDAPENPVQVAFRDTQLLGMSDPKDWADSLVPVVGYAWGVFQAGYKAASDAHEKDAKRYRRLRMKVCGIGGKGFEFVNLPEMPENWSKGSIAQHFDEAMDNYMESEGK